MKLYENRLLIYIAATISIVGCNGTESDDANKSNVKANMQNMQDGSEYNFDTKSEFSELKKKLNTSDLKDSIEIDGVRINVVSDPIPWIENKGKADFLNNSAKIVWKLTFTKPTKINSLLIGQYDHLKDGYISEIIDKTDDSCFSKTNFTSGDYCYVETVYTQTSNSMVDRKVAFLINGKKIETNIATKMVTNQLSPILKSNFEGSRSSDWSDIRISIIKPGVFSSSANMVSFGSFGTFQYINEGSSSSIVDDMYNSFTFSISDDNQQMNSSLSFPKGVARYSCLTSQPILPGQTCGINFDISKTPDYDRSNPYKNLYRFIAHPNSEVNQLDISERVLLSKGLLEPISGTYAKVKNIDTSYEGFEIDPNIEVGHYLDNLKGDPFNYLIPNVQKLQRPSIYSSSVLPSYGEYESQDGSAFRLYSTKNFNISPSKFEVCNSLVNGIFESTSDEHECRAKLQVGINKAAVEKLLSDLPNNLRLTRFVVKGVLSVDYYDPNTKSSMTQPLDIVKITYDDKNTTLLSALKTICPGGKIYEEWDKEQDPWYTDVQNCDIYVGGKDVAPYYRAAHGVTLMLLSGNDIFPNTSGKIFDDVEPADLQSVYYDDDTVTMAGDDIEKSYPYMKPALLKYYVSGLIFNLASHGKNYQCLMTPQLTNSDNVNDLIAQLNNKKPYTSLTCFDENHKMVFYR